MFCLSLLQVTYSTVFKACALQMGLNQLKGASLLCVCSYSAAGLRLSQLKGDNFPFCSSWAQDSYLRVGLKIRNKRLGRKEFPGALSVSIAGWRRSYLCSLKHSERECPKSTIHLRIALYNFLPGWTHLIILCLHCLQKGKLFLSQIGPSEDNIW